MTMDLRDYQRETLDAIAARFFDGGIRRQLVVLSTGTGKTIVFAHVRHEPRLRAWLERVPSAQQRILVLAHREELLNQSAEKIHRANPDLTVEVEQADRRASVFADVVVAGVQTLTAREDRRLQYLDPRRFQIIICDEAHHAASPSYRRVFAHFGLINEEGGAPTAPTDKLLVGFTATPNRGDDIGLECVFEEVVYSKTLREMIAAKYLAPLSAIAIRTNLSLDGVHTKRGEFDTKELAETVNTPERNAIAVAGWKKHAAGRKTVAFTVDIQHAHDLAAMFQGAGVRAEAISGKTDRDERYRLLQQFRDGQIDILTNAQLLTEGWDCPEVACILHTRPTKSSLLYCQMTGRATRLAPGKADALILDLVDLTSRHSLNTTATLFGLPPMFDAEGKNLQDVAAEVESLQARYPSLSIEDAVNLAALKARAVHVDLWRVPDLGAAKAWVSLNWIKDSDQRYRLSYPVGTEIAILHERVTVERNLLNHWDVVLLGGHRSAPTQSTLIRDVGTLQEALTRAEGWITANRGSVVRLKSRDAGWRKHPASEKQVALLKRFRIPHKEGLSKGEASDLLDLHAGRRGGLRA